MSDAREPRPEAPTEPTSPPLGALARGVAASVACDALFTVPWTLLRRYVRPENVLNAVEIMLLSLNMLVGYVGGRAASRGGLAHDDARAQWLLAWLATLGSALVQHAVLRFRPLPPTALRGSPLEALVQLAVVVALVRFGFAMGTYAQARRDGRVDDGLDGPASNAP